jgi:hypothetical protein
MFRCHVRRALGASLLIVAAAAPVTIGATPASATSAAAPNPVVTPLTGGAGVPVMLGGTHFDLGVVGYEQHEFAVAGTARSFAPEAPLTEDGRWRTKVDQTASYATRALVYRPLDASKFNGTVIVEWLNVSGGVDAAPDWTLTHNFLVREGYVWVGVSAQQVGLDNTISADPVRYAALHHPGDSFSYDMFSQAGQAVRSQCSLMLGGLRPAKVLAVGESQSAGRLVTYIDGARQHANVFDGYFVHSRGASGAPLSQSPQADVPAPMPTKIRNDIAQPVMVIATETDVSFGNTLNRQPDTDRFRLWEIAGTSHFDDYGLAIGPDDIGDGQGAVANLAAMQDPPTSPGGLFTCNLPINTGGAHWVLNDAVQKLQRWVMFGEAPPIAPRLQVVSTSPVVFALDANGNALGGIRTPQVDAPIAALSGIGNSGSGPIGGFCFLFGVTLPYNGAQLSARYPTHEAFVHAWVNASWRAVGKGFLLAGDARELNRAAELSTIGS